MRIIKYLQHDESDCGAACIAIILHYYGKTVPLRKIRHAAGTDKVGTSGYGIIRGAEKFDLHCKGFGAKEKERLTEIPLPSIFHLKYEYHEHYVVVYRITKKHVFVSDPASGLEKILLVDFLSQWTGVYFILHPNSSFTTGGDTHGIFFRFFSLLVPYKKIVIQILIGSILLSFFGIFLSFYFRFLIDEVLYSQIQSTLNISSLCYFIVILFQSIISLCRSELLMVLSAKVDVSLISDFFRHLVNLPMIFFSSRKTGEILSRINDVATIKNAISSTTLSVVIDSIMIIIGGAFLFHMGSRLLPSAIIPVFISSLVVFLFRKKFQRSIRENAIINAEKNAAMYETINGIATIKGLATEEHAIDRAETRIVDSIYKYIELTRLSNWQNAILAIISSSGTLAVYWLGSTLIINNEMTLGQLISFTTLVNFFLSPLSRLLTMQSYWQEVFVSAERLSDILEIETESNSENNKDEVDDLKGEIVYNDVSFSYGTRGRALKNISLKIPAGKKVAFVGMSGSGKTTLLKLLMRFYSCEEGKITINNVDINEYAINSYRRKIGYVPQETLMFSGSIYENLTWGGVNIQKKDVIDAVSSAEILEFIDNLPDKINTYVGEQGATLSGGERQRLALARVLLKDPHFLILDEATASLDSISESKIMNTIHSKIHDRTVIIVAHRLSTIMNCDIIFVFDKGSLVESGAHDDLLILNKKYAALWKAQNEKNVCQAT